jgi:hypothetical protein
MDIDTPGMAATNADSTLRGNNHNQNNLRSQELSFSSHVPFVVSSFPTERFAGHVDTSRSTAANANSTGNAAADSTTNVPGALPIPSNAIHFGQIRAWNVSQQPSLGDPQNTGYAADNRTSLYGTSPQASSRVPSGPPWQPADNSNLAPTYVPTFPIVTSGAPVHYPGQMPMPQFSNLAAASAYQQMQSRYSAYPYVHANGTPMMGYQRHPRSAFGVGPDTSGQNGQVYSQNNHNRGHNNRRRSRRPDDQGPNMERRPSPPRFQGSPHFPVVPLPGDVEAMTSPVVVSRRADASTYGFHRPPGSAGAYYGAVALQANLQANLQATSEDDAISTVLGLQPQSQSQPQAAVNGNGRSSNNGPVVQNLSAPLGLDDPRTNRPEPKEAEDMVVNLECKVCMSQMVDTVILPCGHAILCRWCADQALRRPQSRAKGGPTCPMCRKHVRQTVIIPFCPVSYE